MGNQNNQNSRHNIFKTKLFKMQVPATICDGLGITLGEFFSTPEFDGLEQEIK